MVISGAVTTLAPDHREEGLRCAVSLQRAPAGRAGTVRSWIDHGGEVVWDPSPSLVTQLVAAGQPFWLDIQDPTDEVVDQMAAALGLPPLAALRQGGSVRPEPVPDSGGRTSASLPDISKKAGRRS
jgi:hypothetical protein